MFKIIRAWYRWHGHWEDLCDCCGLCCYSRTVAKDGSVQIDYGAPCQFLDTESHLCMVYEERFEACPYCRKVDLWTALFHPTLPDTCAYVVTFRPWKRHKRGRS